MKLFFGDGSFEFMIMAQAGMPIDTDEDIDDEQYGEG